MKKYFITGIIVIVGIIYYTGLYTYFIHTDVQETLPMPSNTGVLMNTLLMGNFVEVDFIHKGSGTAKIVKVGDKNILRLEDFNVTSGPDLYIYLSKTGKPTGDIKSLEDYIDLGLLKGTSGNQNYEINIPDISGYKTAVVWCKRYGALFTYAVMEQ